MNLPSSSSIKWSRDCALQRVHAFTAMSLCAVALSSTASAQVNRLDCWGRNVEGQCSVPSSLGSVVSAAGGVYHTIALRPDGLVSAWGLNAEGQTAVPATLSDVISIAAGSFHNAAAKSDGTVVCWGRNVEGQCNVPAGINTVTAVAAGWKHTLALRANGSVAAWGATGSAQIAVPAGLASVSRISAGSQHNVVLLSDGTVRCWGAGTSNSGVSPNFGQSIVPAGLAGVVSVAAGANHSVALKSDGTVVCWGQSAFGISTPPAGLSGVVAIAAGNAHTLALKSDRSIVGWGSNSSGQLTLPSTLRVPIAIFAGGQHSGAIHVNAPSASLASVAGSVCHGATGSIDVTVNDAPAASWVGPNGFTSSNVDLVDVAAGVYVLTATGSGGSTTLSVTVPTLPDVAAPVVSSYATQLSAPAVQDCSGLVPDFTSSVVASDDCSASAALVVSQSPAAGSIAPFGDSAVTIRVRDESGNESSVLATVSVVGTPAVHYVDADADGFGNPAANGTFCVLPAGYVVNSSDCNDGDASIHPGAAEVCNDIDENCDGSADEGVPTNDYYRDADIDGFGDALVIARDCAMVPPAGYVANATDCNDGAANVHPGADERCGDRDIDNDCDGSFDESESIDLIRFYADIDEDGAGDAAASVLRCEMPQGFVANSTDLCPSNGALVQPVTYFRDFDQDEFGDANNTVSVCETLPPTGYITDSSDCNDRALLFADVDGDGHGAGDFTACGVTTSDDECPNTAALIAPIDWYGDADQDGAGDPAVISNACDVPAGFVGNTNDQCPAIGALQSPVVYFIDSDADGFGVNAATTSVCETSAPAGYSAVATDCDDAVSTSHPGAPELCNVVDDDCDTVVDEDLVFSTYYRDADGDSHGDAAVTESNCTGSPSAGHVRTSGDCDDARAEVHAMAPFHIDADLDGFGVSQTAMLCEVVAPSGYSSNATDCNDGAIGINPGTAEVCDAADTDENCSGSADDADPSVSAASKFDFFADADADTFTVASASRFCDIKPGFLAAASAAADCNDGNAAINPSVAETCNGIDDDCTGAADDGLTFTTYHRDADGDAFGSLTVTESNCLGAPSSGFILASGDCDDADPLSNPAGIELCANLAVDNDCDGSIAEGEATDRMTIYADVDADGAGDAAASVLSCTVLDGFSANSNDQCPSNGDLISQVSYFRDVDADGAGDASDSILSCESSAPAGFTTTSNDGCPTDAAKLAPGICGCGTADTDTDSDGTADCNDQCPNDPAKIAPGACGCGIADTDTDSDGTSDCNDQCPNDPAKIAPGACGCGTADTDTDSDGVADCASFMLSLDPISTSVRSGQFLTVRVSSGWPAVDAPQRGIALQLAVRFDHTRLRLDSVNNGIAGAPFTLELARSVGIDTDPASTDPLRGILRYAAGLNVFGSPADTGMVAAAPLVDLVFEVLPGTTDCGVADLVRVVPAIGNDPVRTRITTEEVGGASGSRRPTPTPMMPVALDFDAPVLSSVPAEVTLPTDAGSAVGAAVAEPVVTATDGCDGAITPAILVLFPDGSTATSWPAQFPSSGSGATIITWTATDAAGNATSASMRVEVANYQRMDATITLQGAFSGNSTRTIRIAGPAFSQVFTVAMNGVSGQINDIHVPVRAAYECVAAKDLGHGITTTTAASVIDRKYQTSFVLRQGDSNNDDVVDIYDFSLFAADRGLASGASARSNFNADIAINNADFAFISTNFFRSGDACSAGAQGRSAVTRVSVKELRRQGLGHLSAADMNGDGWVDLRDIQLYMQGQGITPESIEVPLGGNG
ncbi:MAG: hypothetical protein RLZZ116_2233 [Planctomycetota bacterium]|jgi:hypothetical protein